MKKVESQQGFIEQLRDLFGSGSVDEEVPALQSQDAESAWTTAVKKQALWKLHRVAFSEQLKGMKTIYQRPNLHPSLQSYFYANCETIDILVVGIEIGACPFCTKGFDLCGTVGSHHAAILTILGVHILIFQDNQSAYLRIAVQSPTKTSGLWPGSRSLKDRRTNPNYSLGTSASPQLTGIR